MIEFVLGFVIKVMKEGYFFYIDEINMVKLEILFILNGVLDYRKMMINLFIGEVIWVKEGFGVIVVINEGYVGIVLLNEVLKNCFVIIDVFYIKGELLK